VSDDSAEFTVSLNDKVSGPSAQANAGLGALNAGFLNVGSSSGSSGLAMAGWGTAVASKLVPALKDAVVNVAELGMHSAELQESALALAQSEYGSAKAAHAVVEAQYAVASASSLTQDAVFALGTKLEDAGVSAGAFKDYLQALSETASVAGEAATKPIEKVIKKVEQLGKFQIKDTDLKGSGVKVAEVYDELAKRTGESTQQIATDIKLGRISAEQGLDALTDVMHNKFGDAAGEKALGLANQFQKAKENIGNLFKDVDAGPLKSALHQSLGLLDSNTRSGAALKKTLTAAMSGFMKAAAATIPYVEAFLLGLGIAALDTYIAFKPTIKSVEKLLGIDGKKTEASMKNAASAGKALGFVLSSVVVGMAAIWTVGTMAFQGIVKGATAVAGVWPRMVAGVKGAYSAIKGGLTKAVDYIKGLPQDFEDAGNAMIDGLINAIKAGASKVAGAVTDMAKGAVTAAKAALGIKSPSRVFAGIGENVTSSFSGTVDKGRPKVEASLTRLVGVPRSVANDNAKPWGRAAAVSSSSSTSSITIAAGAVVVHIHMQPGQDSTEVIEETARRTFGAMLSQMRAAVGE
jgi:hypothetical protein